MSRFRRITDKTPAELGYRFPAEWEEQSGTWFSWPRPEGISFPGYYDRIPAQFAAIFKAITPRQIVHLNVLDGDHEREVRDVLASEGVDLGRVTFHHIRTNESWCRDHGPAFLVRETEGQKGGRELAVVNWGYNAWGGKYPPYDLDDAVPVRIAEELGLPLFEPGIVMEGGAIDVNGKGCLLTTESCLLNPNRNPGLGRDEIERYLRDFYGQSHILWLGEGIEGDDTDGHVDDLARFLNPTTIAVAEEPDTSDPNHAVLREAIDRCGALRDQDGHPFDLCVLPMPGRVEREGTRLPATYLNFLFVNGALLVPTFRDKVNDASALAILDEALPDHEVIGIDCTELIWGLGAIHCASQQVPRVSQPASS
ncbi:MAG: agmatine/peptidylarginine deiminase [Phycisphaerales bacterium JB040]